MTPRTFVYVSNAEDGTIGIHAMDRDSGRLTAIGTVEAGANVMPMAVAPDRRHLYASIRSQPFRVVTFAIDATTGALTQKASAPLADSMCSLAVDATGRHLLSASYGGSLVAVNPIGDDGVITGGAAGICRPAGTRIRSFWIIPARPYVPCLGTDEVMQYAFDGKSGRLTALAPCRSRPAPATVRDICGSRPTTLRLRALRIDRPRRAIRAPANSALVFIDECRRYRRESGLVPGVPPVGSNATNDPCLVYGAPTSPSRPMAGSLCHRAHHLVDRLPVDRQGVGALRFVDTASTETQPRGIRLTSDGRFLVASGERSDQLAVHRIDTVTGKLSLAGRYPGGRGANWVEIVDFD
jgi:6-phosphogluconolactonase